jgi:hypothetical protein
VKKAVATCVQVPPGGHTGHTADVTILEGHSPLGQAGEVGCVGPITAVGGQHPAV